MRSILTAQEVTTFRHSGSKVRFIRDADGDGPLEMAATVMAAFERRWTRRGRKRLKS